MHLQPVGSIKWQIKAAMVSSVYCNKVSHSKNVVKTVPPEVLKEQVFEWGATHSGCLAHACHEHSSVPCGLHLPALLAKHSRTNPRHSYDDSKYSSTITFSNSITAQSVQFITLNRFLHKGPPGSLYSTERPKLTEMENVRCRHSKRVHLRRDVVKSMKAPVDKMLRHHYGHGTTGPATETRDCPNNTTGSNPTAKELRTS